MYLSFVVKRAGKDHGQNWHHPCRQNCPLLSIRQMAAFYREFRQGVLRTLICPKQHHASRAVSERSQGYMGKLTDGMIKELVILSGDS